MGRGMLAVTVVAALAVAAVSGGCGTPSTELVGRPASPAVNFAGARFENAGVSGATLVFDLSVSNPNSSPLPLAGADYSVTTAGRPLMSGRVDFDYSAPPHESVLVPVQVPFEYARLLSLVEGLRPGMVVPYRADIVVAVNAATAGPSRLPVSLEGKLPVAAPPEVCSISVSWKTLTLDEASGTVTVTLANPNQFPLNLVSLSYSLSTGGVPIAKSKLDRAAALNAGGGTGTVEIPVSIIPRNLGVAIGNLITGQKADYRLTGFVDVNTPFGAMSLPLAGTVPE